MTTDRASLPAVRKAVILAAGRGTRLGSLTTNTPKPLLEVAGRPLVVHVLDGLVRAGVTDFTIITGYLGDQVERELGNGAAAGIEVRYIHQAQLDGTARAVALARDWLDGERFFAGWADILVRPETYAAVIRASRLADAALAINRTSDPFAGAAVYVDNEDGDGLVTRIVEKPPRGTSATPWNNAGLCVLGPEAWPFIDRLDASPRAEYELPQAIAAMVEAGLRVRSVPVAGPWFDVGTPEDLEQARLAFSPQAKEV